MLGKVTKGLDIVEKVAKAGDDGNANRPAAATRRTRSIIKTLTVTAAYSPTRAGPDGPAP